MGHHKGWEDVKMEWEVETKRTLEALGKWMSRLIQYQLMGCI